MTGGAGFTSNMQSSQRNNNRLLERRAPLLSNKLNIGPKVSKAQNTSAEHLLKYRKQALKDKRNNTIRSLLLIIASLCICIVAYLIINHKP